MIIISRLILRTVKKKKEAMIDQLFKQEEEKQRTYKKVALKKTVKLPELYHFKFWLFV
jgi:hypothetical protein